MAAELLADRPGGAAMCSGRCRRRARSGADAERLGCSAQLVEELRAAADEGRVHIGQDDIGHAQQLVVVRLDATIGRQRLVVRRNGPV